MFGNVGVLYLRRVKIIEIVDDRNVPPALAEQLGLRAFLNAPLVLADSREVTVGQGLAYLQLMGRNSGIPIGIMDVPVPLLGVSALEVLGLKVNPRAGTLEYDRPFGAAALLLRGPSDG